MGAVTEYRYTAVDLAGRTHTGTAPAPDRRSLALELQAQGRFLLAAEPATRRARRLHPSPPQKSSYRARRSDLIHFTVSLQTLVEAGVPLISGIYHLLPQIPRRGLRLAVTEVMRDLEQGTSFADALRRHPGVFPEIYCEIVAGGEESGQLEQVLKDLVANLEWTHETVGLVRKAVGYPLFLLGAVATITTGMLAFLVPRFTAVFAKMGAPMPPQVRILDTASRILREQFHLLLAACGAVLLCLLLMKWSLRLRRLLASAFGRIPLVARALRTIALSRLLRTLALLLDAGVPIPRALELTGHVSGDPLLAEGVEKILLKLDQGKEVSEAFAHAGVFPPLVTFMVATGEKTGRLSFTLEKAGAHLGREARAAVERLVRLMEPALIVGMGVIVGGISACMLTGIYGLLQSLRQG